VEIVNKPMVLATDRGAGKTTQAIAWVSQGFPVPGYPGWSRVLVVGSARLHQIVKSHWWARLEDFDHRVYPAPEWIAARGVNPDVAVCVDDVFDLDVLTACPWENVEFRERRRPVVW
jgi:hypothetical protein